MQKVSFIYHSCKNDVSGIKIIDIILNRQIMNYLCHPETARKYV